jgi:cyclophilin family peptidyl-prolyl cis-trans isomerase
MRRLLALPLVSIAIAVAGCGGDGGGTTAAIPSADAPTTAAATSTPADTTGQSGADVNTVTVTSTPTSDACKTVSDPGPKKVSEKKPTAKLKAGVDYTVTLQTSCGTIPILLGQGDAPKTAASFAHLVQDGFFDDLTFHRIVPGFVVQGGDPKGTGAGGPGYTITETPPKDATYTRGVVAMAKTGAEAAGTSGSQFFIVTGDDAGLPADYAIVGKVTGDGMTVADAISAVPTDSQDKPTSPVVIEKATLTTG